MNNFTYTSATDTSSAEPLTLDCVWMPAELAAPLLLVDFTRAVFYDELARHCGVRLTYGDEQIYAEVPTATERRLLAVPRHAAVLRIVTPALVRRADFRV